jgi:hypothetical protein
MDDDRCAIVQNTCRVTAENHGKPILTKADTFEAPDVMVIEARGANVDLHPTLGHLSVRLFTQGEGIERVFRIK